MTPLLRKIRIFSSDMRPTVVIDWRATKTAVTGVVVRATVTPSPERNTNHFTFNLNITSI